MLLSVGLESVARGAVAGSRHRAELVAAALAGTEVGRGDALVGVGSLLGGNLLVGRLAGAAADGDEPEEARGNGEGNTEPENGEHLGAEIGLDLVWLENGVEDGDEATVDGGSSSSGGEEEDGLSLESLLVVQTCEVNCPEVLTVETMVVTRLPQRLKMAKIPTMNSATVNAAVITKPANIHLAALW